MNNKTQNNKSWIDECHLGVRYGLEGKVLINEQSPFQKITIVESDRYGKSLLLDDCWMTAEYQERHYHESLVHPALCSAKEQNDILIIGGGDGGTAKECLRHKNIKRIDMVEIDNRVVELSKKYLPNIGGNAWEDPRTHINIADGITWVSDTKDNSYDVILVDGSDPNGPSKGLFNKAFLQECKRILRVGGIFATQSESPESFREIHLDIVRTTREVFEFADPLYGCVPMYPSGWWSWTFAAIDEPRYKTPMATRGNEIKDACEIWSIEWQKASFETMPAFIKRALGSKNE